MTQKSKQYRGTLREFLKTSLPAVIDLSSMPLVWLYEAYLLSKISIEAFGSVGLAFQLIVVTLTVVLTFIIGSSLIINRHLGRNDSWEANHIFGQSMMLGIGLSFFIGFIWYFGAPLIFKLIKETEPVAQIYGIQYLQTIAYFSPIIIMTFISLGILRSVGDTYYAMIINFVIIGINLLLAPLLMFDTPGLRGLEVVGLALAKGIAFTVGFALTAILLRSRKARLFLSMREMATPKWESVKKLFKSGIPTTVEQLTWSIGMFIVYGYAARLGVVVLATHTILLLLQSVMSMFYQGFGFSSMALIGKKVGAEELLRAERTGRVASGVMLFTVLLLVLIIYSYSLEILQTFTNDKEVLDLGLKVIFIFALVQIPKALNTVVIGNLRGAGELKWIMWVTIASVVIFEISASWAVVFMYQIFQFALAGIWIVHGFDEISRFLFNYARFRNGKWKLQDV